MNTTDRILILDFGSQYTPLIARRIRELQVYCEILPSHAPDSEIRAFQARGIVLSGGPETVTQEQAPRAPECVYHLGCPVLGICYGMQTMALQLGGRVTAHPEQSEFGQAHAHTHHPSDLLDGLDAQYPVWMSHTDSVTHMPPGFQSICATERTPIAGMAHVERSLFAIQFHPEVTHTPSGKQILSNFLFKLCRCRPSWTTQHMLSEQIEALRQTLNNDRVLIALSGGVDSAVLAALLHRAIFDRVVCVFVDTGLLRENEGASIASIFHAHFGHSLELIQIDAKDRFFQALKNVSNPEKKRKICGELFVRVFEEAAHSLGCLQWLAQGTIYPDVIESACHTGKTIKSHHNVGGLPERMHLKLVEPLRVLFKDEVRRLGVELGLPHELIHRHPFPGPGLAVRILGPIDPHLVAITQKADALFLEALHQSGWYERLSQAFAVLLPVRTVGVKGDARHEGYVIALRAVTTQDFMTATWAELPHTLLFDISHAITNQIPEVTRVVYDITGKPPATIEWE